MTELRLFTSESVTEGHPDKICDQISDSILDAILAADPRGRVAVETLVTTGLVHVAGEVSTSAYVEIPAVHLLWRLCWVAACSLTRCRAAQVPETVTAMVFAKSLVLIVQQINNFVPPVATTKFSWKEEIWGCALGFQPGGIFDDDFLAPAVVAARAAFQIMFQAPNVHYYRLGLAERPTSLAVSGNDGGPPIAADYDAAYNTIDKEVDLFNLMVLPPDAAVSVQSLYPNASNFCRNRRAFLLMGSTGFVDRCAGCCDGRQCVSGGVRIG